MEDSQVKMTTKVWGGWRNVGDAKSKDSLHIEEMMLGNQLKRFWEWCGGDVSMGSRITLVFARSKEEVERELLKAVRVTSQINSGIEDFEIDSLFSEEERVALAAERMEGDTYVA
jgi:hypothetical protein